jgi:hypothetical protein
MSGAIIRFVRIAAKNGQVIADESFGYDDFSYRVVETERRVAGYTDAGELAPGYMIADMLLRTGGVRVVACARRRSCLRRNIAREIRLFKG